jgi:hypothetical protein
MVEAAGIELDAPLFRETAAMRKICQGRINGALDG